MKEQKNKRETTEIEERKGERKVKKEMEIGKEAEKQKDGRR